MEQVLSLSESAAVPGLVLAAPVLDSHGNLLVAAGTALTASLLASLERRNVAQVCVHVADTPRPDAAAVRDRLEKLFRKCDTGIARTELMERMLAYRMGKPL